MIGKILAAAAAIVSGDQAASPAADAPTHRTIAIVGATVLPMTGAERLQDQTVVVERDTIAAVGPRASIRVPAGARMIDARGQVLMPGLVDMHVHLAPVPGQAGDAAQRALAVMLAHGVTTARGMAGSPANLEVRRRIEAGELAGPRFYAAAPGLNVQNTATAEAARAAVVKAKAAGFDVIKSHHLPDVAVWQAVADEARAQKIPTAGHVANSVGLSRAMAAGQQVEHLDGVIAELIRPGTPEKAIDFGQIPPPPVLQAAAKASDTELAALARRVAAARSWHVPTLSLFEKIGDVATPTDQLAAGADMRFVPDAALKQWAAQREQLRGSGFSAAHGAALRDIRRRITSAFHRAGVPLMAGSDTAQAFHIWGPGLHQEIAALAAAGLTPMQALRAATVVPRDYFRSLANGGSALGWKANFGTVERGARADLILLASDPSRNLQALGRPNAVIAGGRLFDRPALDAMLARAAADAKGAPVVAAASPPRTVYVMRHLEKGAGDDPPLSRLGAARAQQLAQMLAGSNIKALFASTTRRAQETAAPLASRLGLSVTPYDPRNPAALESAAKAVAGNILVVGHSNTVPDLVERFGGKRPADLGEQDYGVIFIVEPGSSDVRQLLIEEPAGGERG